MNKNYIIKLLSASLLSANAFAGAMGPAVPDWSLVTSVSAGPVWGSGGDTQTLFIAPGILRTYVDRSGDDTLFNGEIFLGVQQTVWEYVQGQLGIAVAATNNARLNGVIWDDADPAFDNYTYKYKLQHTRVTLKGKLLADYGYWATPWISASIGLGFNDSHSYRSRPTIPEALPIPRLGSEQKTAFSYTVGAGFQKAWDEHWQVGAGYEFADWGHNQLHRPVGQISGHGLSMNHYYTNGLLFNITYLV